MYRPASSGDAAATLGCVRAGGAAAGLGASTAPDRRLGNRAAAAMTTTHTTIARLVFITVSPQVGRTVLNCSHVD
jgi:hypothetical protein